MKFLSLAQFTEMWKLQDSLNTATSGPDWKEKNQNWNLAIKDEILEFCNYLGWKWWKEPDKTKSPTDMQARLELVDIWHFLLSEVIEDAATSCGTGIAYDMIKNSLPNNMPVTEDPIYWIQFLDVPYEISRNDFSQRIYELSNVMLHCDWTWEELYKAYIGKVALNNFRQANGYKEGTYQKIWQVVETSVASAPFVEYHELEDNYFLERILAELSLTEGALTYEAVYHKLGFEYMIRTTE